MVERDKIKGPKPLADESLQEQDDFLDEALDESFPASDPIAPDHEAPKHKPK
jgi:hypothetical protein